MEKTSTPHLHIPTSPHPNYFSLLTLSPAFDIELKSLEFAYFEQQKKFHPDRFANKPAPERQEALQRSADINQAYHTLKEPLTRAQYLLSLQGVVVGKEQDTVKPSPEVLMEAMELREQPLPKDALEKMIQESIARISGFYKKGEWNAMAQETLRLGYIEKAKDQTPQHMRA